MGPRTRRAAAVQAAVVAAAVVVAVTGAAGCAAGEGSAGSKDSRGGRDREAQPIDVDRVTEGPPAEMVAAALARNANAAAALAGRDTEPGDVTASADEAPVPGGVTVRVVDGQAEATSGTSSSCVRIVNGSAQVYAGRCATS